MAYVGLLLFSSPAVRCLAHVSLHVLSLISYFPGKSSLTVALFRLVEIESGQITLDGVDLAGLGLSDVRGRSNGMTIIPQDPFLAGATLRECLDPFGESNDNDIMDALDAVRLGKKKDAENGTEDEGVLMLDTIVQEGGSNYRYSNSNVLRIAF